MDNFLEKTAEFSFSALVDKDQDQEVNVIDDDGQAQGTLLANPSSSSRPKTKKDKKNKKRKAEVEDQNLTAEADGLEEDVATTEDPYLLADLGDEDHDEAKCTDPTPSKRAMQRAVQGFTRRSGGWKHKKKAGKGPAKGRGKKCVDVWWVAGGLDVNSGSRADTQASTKKNVFAR